MRAAREAGSARKSRCHAEKSWHAANGLEPVLKRLKDREQAPELPEPEMEVSVIFPASGEASEMLQPGECPLDFPSVSVIETVPLREVSQRLVFPFDERTDQTDA